MEINHGQRRGTIKVKDEYYFGYNINQYLYHGIKSSLL
jgi:hypothetical protein